MSVNEELLEHNRRYAADFQDGDLPTPPSRRMVIVTCMDSRLMLYELLGLRNGEAHVIRNAGGIVNEETLRSLLISTRLLATRDVVVINHTECGMLTFTEEGFRAKLREELGRPIDPFPLYAFDNLEENVRWQVEKIRTAPLLPPGLNVCGFVYDVKSGCLKEVPTPAA
ncbi:MAG TPA: carbonic anhydrase [bacterium]|nr:carbonic anhydrase [bacterium]